MEEFDIVGIGVGPANLALATALLDARDQGQDVPSALFLEREAQFGWHAGAMLPGSRVQVPFTKDLATQRNPRSRYTFLNYLHEQGRLEDFINLREMFPERDEFAHYMAWIVGQAGPLVRFASEVQELFPVVDARGGVQRVGIAVSTAEGPLREMSARCLVLGVGHRPWLPPGVQPAPRAGIVHTSQLRRCIDAGPWSRTQALRFLVVGGGQSGVEAACYLLREFPLAHVEICTRHHAARAIDDNPFVNQWYGGRAADLFQDLAPGAREGILADLSHSNLGVAERGLLDELYRHHYRGLCTGQPRVSFLRGHALVAADPGQGRVDCILRGVQDGVESRRAVDAAVFATGYDDAEPALLRPLDAWLVRDAQGACEFVRDYRLRTRSRMDAAVFLHGAREDRHGPAERSLSTRAVRAGVLLAALRCALRVEET